MNLIEFKTKDVGAFLEDAKREFFALSEEAAYDVAGEILETAKDKCPVQTGRLRNSGRVVKSRTRRRNTVQVKIRFGGGKRAPYAVPVHYDPSARHTQGEDRFLEKAVDQHAEELPQLIRTRWKVR